MESFFVWLFKGTVGIILAIGAFIMKNLHSELVKLRDKQGQLDMDLSAHKLEAEKRYAKEETLQSSLARVHERIDSMDVRVNSKLDKIQDTIMGMR